MDFNAERRFSKHFLSVTVIIFYKAPKERRSERVWDDASEMVPASLLEQDEGKREAIILPWASQVR